jgi:sigma-B regulation protein RsbU (phosphoserine phosphatase)
MESDMKKSKDELIEELMILRKQAESADALRQRLADVEKVNAELQSNFEKLSNKYIQECSCRGDTEEALRMAEVIVDRSPTILFRRKADDKSTLVYVSNNIEQIGYTVEEFLSGRMHFKYIVHPDDQDRVGKEVRSYAEKDVEEYTQVYRITKKLWHWLPRSRKVCFLMKNQWSKVRGRHYPCGYKNRRNWIAPILPHHRYGKIRPETKVERLN